MISDAVLTLIISSVTGICTLVLGWLIKRDQNIQSRKVDSIHKEVNGHMSEYLKATKALGEKVGKEEGRAEVVAEVKEAKEELKADIKEAKEEVRKDLETPTKPQ